MTDDLKPCPFCGSTDIEFSEYMIDGGQRENVQCQDCWAELGGWKKPGEAIAAWNTRTPAVAETPTCIHMTAEMAESCPTCNPGFIPSPDTQDAAQDAARIKPGAVDALAAYQQADMDGIMVLVSRQAIEECLPALRAIEGER